MIILFHEAITEASGAVGIHPWYWMGILDLTRGIQISSTPVRAPICFEWGLS
jgi:hypothetical protein